MVLREKEEILFEWVCPKQVSDAAVKASLRRWMVFVPRVLLVTAILWTALYFALDYVFPPNSDISLDKLFILGFIVVIVPLGFICLTAYLTEKYSRTKYRITSKRVAITTSSGTKAIKWNSIVTYELFDYKEFEAFSGIRFFTYKGRSKISICLPADDRSAQIIKYIADRVPLLEKTLPSFEIIKLSLWQKVCLWFITVLFSLCASFYLAFNGPAWSIGLVYIVLFLGPGTIFVCVVYGRRYLNNNSLKFYICAFNLLSVVLILLLAVWLRLWQLKRECGW